MRLIDADELMQEIKSLRIVLNGKPILNIDEIAEQMQKGVENG